MASFSWNDVRLRDAGLSLRDMSMEQVSVERACIDIQKCQNMIFIMLFYVNYFFTSNQGLFSVSYETPKSGWGYMLTNPVDIL